VRRCTLEILGNFSRAAKYMCHHSTVELTRPDRIVVNFAKSEVLAQAKVYHL